MIAVLIIVSVLAALATSALTFNVAAQAETETSRKGLRALYLADAAVSEALAEVVTRTALNETVPGNLGSHGNPLHLAGGDYWAQITDNGDNTYTVVTTGSIDGAQRSIEVLVRNTAGIVFDTAVYAGNSDGDSNYELRFSGEDGQADEVSGAIYSGGDISIEGDADVDGELQASGTISGGTGIEGQAMAVPDIDGMNYSVNNDFDVASLFASSTNEWDSLGGYADQMPESSPAHIFRRNASDRNSENNSTTKDDYYLEDPYEATSGADYRLSLTGTMGDPGPSGTDKVYFIDGNLWIHNYGAYGFEATNTDAEGFRVTFVVKGNIYFSDNVKLNDDDNDAIAFIAIEDDTVSDSGNIYFGDPEFGTLEEMEAYMYAENNFFDYNLNSSGSAEVKVMGTMSAGNQVSIERDYTYYRRRRWYTQHSKLEVEFDSRLSDGTVSLPGIPSQGEADSFEVAYWREVASN
ncbi:MAG: hypothetical protein GY711_32535 [bacterium]|nr:hypothetical protein [bacterium]